MTRRTVSPVFIGREDELTRINTAHRRTVDRRPAAVVVSGEAGIGKSRFVAELLAGEAAAGSLTLLGRCSPVGEAALPYAPYVEALRSLVPGRSRSQFLRLLAPALRPAVTGGDPSAFVALGVDPTGQMAAFAAILDLLERRARSEPIVLVIEDVHWAGPSTLELTGLLLRNAPPGVLPVVTVRQGDAAASASVDRMVQEVSSQEGGELIELAPLSRNETARLVEQIIEGPPRPEVLEGIQDRSGGNPFLVEELCAAAMHGDVESVPAHVKALFLSRLGTLSPVAQSLLQTASVMGDVVDVAILAHAAGLKVTEATSSAEELVQRSILRRDTVDSLGTYGFRHSLLREAIEEDLAPEERRRLHRRVAVTLTGRRRPEHLPSGLAAELAHHWQAAGEPSRAIPHWARAAEEAVSVFAFDEAARGFSRAVEQWTLTPPRDPPAGLSLWRLCLQAAEVFAIGGDLTTAERFLDRAESASSDPDELLHTRERRAAFAWSNGDERRAYAMWRELVGGRPPSPRASAAVLHAWANALMMLARFEEAAPIAQAAVERARTERATHVEADALISLGMALAQSDRVDAGLEAFRQAIARGTEMRSFRHVRTGSSLLTVMLAESERFDEAIAAGVEYRRLTQRLGVPGDLRYLGLENYVFSLLAVGRWEEASRLLDEALNHDLPPRGRAGLLMGRAALRCQRGEIAKAEHDIDEIMRLTPRMAQHSMVGAMHALRAEIAMSQQQPDRAAEEVRMGLAAAEDVVQAQEDMFHELSLLGMRVEAERALGRSGARWERSRQDPRRRAAELLMGLRGRRARRRRSYTLYGNLIAATFDQCRAEARRLRGRAATRLWERAAERWARIHDAHHEAYARFRLAESIVADRGDRNAAAAALGRALEIAASLRARPLRESIERLARQAGLDASTLPHLARQVRDFGLTRRELEVLREIGSGMSNREIGTKLGISEKTSEIHVTNVLRKLGVERRVEAALLAVQLGLIPLDHGVAAAAVDAS